MPCARSRYADVVTARTPEPGSPTRSVALGVVVFVATLILLFGLLNVLRPSGSGGADASPQPTSTRSTAASPAVRIVVAVAIRRVIELAFGVAVARSRHPRGRRHRDLHRRRRQRDGEPRRRHRGCRLHSRRQRLHERHRRPVPRLLRPDLGPLPRPDPPGARQPRLGDQGPGRLPRLLRGGGHVARRHELVLVRARFMARHRRSTRIARRSTAAARIRLRVDGWPPTSRLRRRSAPLRSGTTPDSARASTATTIRWRRSGARSTTAAQTSSSTGTTTTTNGSRRRIRMVARTGRAASASSSSGPAARSCAGSGPSAPTASCAPSGLFGVLRLDLHPASYDWRFIPTAGAFSDTGTAAPCH